MDAAMAAKAAPDVFKIFRYFNALAETRHFLVEKLAERFMVCHGAN